MKRISLWAALLTALIILTLALASCGNDAPVSSRDTSSAEKLNMPDQFDTVATKCNHGNRIYESSGTGGPIAVVAHDPSCRP